ncbi:MAG: T9SS type A sorting domain-containing protein [Bacteroidota bacterium]
MKKLLLLLPLFLVNIILAQTNGYVYKSQLSFDVADSSFSPYLCTVDSTGNLWVVSTNLASAGAIQGLFKAAPGESVIRLVKKFAVEDSIRDITGLTAIGDDVFISSRKIAPSDDQQPQYYPFSQLFYLPGGDPAKIIRFKQPAYRDYGTWYTCIDASKDKHLYYGQSYLMTIGTINADKNSAGFGNTVSFAMIDWGTPLEPGGEMTGPNFIDLIRDIAVDKSADYSDTASVIYTSRCSSVDPGAENKGGIAKWTGGTSAVPAAYRAEKITDLAGYLSIGNNVPSGIAVNPSNGHLFVCGTDSSRQWVKGFQVIGNFAVQTGELPSSTSKDVKDMNGAPFSAPGDVAFNRDGSVAYVTDEGTKKVYRFESDASGVSESGHAVIKSFELQQNYPNPFNPSTSIMFSLQSAGKIKAVVYDIFGKQVSVLADNYYTAGTHILNFDGSKMASGVYFCKVQSGGNSKSIKMVLMK